MPLPVLRETLAAEPQNTSITDSNWSIWQFLERGARCESADWDFPIRESEHRFWLILLPDIQAARTPGRFLAARARIQMVQGKFDDALKTLQVGYALSRHVGDQADFLVQALVGITIANMMSDQVETFVQQPGTPNLYWALVALPRPFISIHRPLEVEASSMYFNFPELRDIDKKVYSPEQWRQLMDQLVDDVFSVLQMTHRNDISLEKLAILNNIIAGYPRAKQALIEEGRSADEVEAMPVAQVVLIYTMHVYDEFCDDQFKWLNLPFAQFQSHSKQVDHDFQDSIRSGRELIPLAATFLPAVEAAKTAEVRTDRSIAVLEILEALRMYGASHDGQLPNSLKDITDVVIPLDPFTDEPFTYHCNGDVAVIESQYAGPNTHNVHALRYEIRFAEKEEK
jgi:hypothetical protein